PAALSKNARSLASQHLEIRGTRNTPVGHPRACPGDDQGSSPGMAGTGPAMTNEGGSTLFGGSWGGRGLPEGRAVGAVDESFGALRRQVFEIVDRALDIVFPHLARQFVEEFDAVAVRVVDIDAVRHAM